MLTAKNTIVVGVFLSLLARDPIAGAEINGKVAAVDGKTLQLTVDGDWLPAVGDPCEIFVELPGVGKARVGVAAISQVKDDRIAANVTRSTATVAAGQLVTISSQAPVRRAGLKVPTLIGRAAADARTVVERAGLTATFEVGIPAPKGITPFTVYAQKPVAGAMTKQGAEIVITIYGKSKSKSTAPIAPEVAPAAPNAPEMSPAAAPRSLKPADDSSKTDVVPTLALDTPNLKGPDKTTAKIVKIVANLMEKQHIAAHPLDDEISRRTFDNLIDAMDPQRMYFFQSDVDGFKQDRYKIDDLIRDGNIDLCYSMFRRYLLRADERVRDLTNVLALDHDFTIDESIVIEGKSLGFPRDASEVRERWRKRIKYELLQETVSGVDLEDARYKIQVRYTGNLNRLKLNSDDDILGIALNQFTHAYDPHSNYISKKTWQDFVIQNEQQMMGIGASLKILNGDVEVVKIIYGSPSYQHGELKSGDRIIAVGQGTDGEGSDGELKDVRGLPLAEVVQQIRGKSGTVVRLKVIPKGKFEAKVYAITRQKFELQTAQATILSGDQLPDGRPAKVGFVYLPSFYRTLQGSGDQQEVSRSVTRDVKKLLSDFQAKQVDVIVLDLRTNTGGSLTECINTAGLFVGKGNVLQVKGRDGKVQQYGADETAMLSGKPVVVLTSALTSSGAEIVAGALQDYRRAIIVGDEATHGSGVVATLQDLGALLFKTKTPPDLGRLKMVMQRFYRPSGDSTQVRGVLADVVLPSMSSESIEREVALKHALQFDKIAPASFTPMDFGIDKKLSKSLRSRSESRRNVSKYFQKLNQRIETYRDQKSRTTLSLNRSEYIARQKLFDADEQEFPSLTEVPDVKADGYLDEALNISLDYLARHKFSTAEAAYKTRQHSTAIAKYKEAVLVDPDFLTGHYKLGWALATGPLRDGKLAVTHAQRAVDLDQSRSWVYHLALAVAHAESGDFAEAQQHLDVALENASEANRSSYQFLRGRFKNQQSYPR